MEKRYFEDIAPDETHILGTWSVTKGEIVAFAKQYDPQTFHVDELAAQEPGYTHE